MTVKKTILAGLALLLTYSPPSMAAHAVGHTPPQGPAARHFPGDFPKLTDSEWGFELGGFGGTARGAAPGRVPVIFVHGNTSDHADWYPVRNAFRAAGWSDQALWAVSYNGLGGNRGSTTEYPNPELIAEHARLNHDGGARITNHSVNIEDVHGFILAVREYTGVPKFSLVAHSLGVTLARAVLKEYPELRADLVAFVGIAGGNHGTSLCPPPAVGVVMSCDELAAGSAFLARLNGPGGADETWAGTRFMTIYDGSGVADKAFLGADYAQSPALAGADNRSFPGVGHNELRLAPEIIKLWSEFIEPPPKRCGARRFRRSLREMARGSMCGN